MGKSARQNPAIDLPDERSRLAIERLYGSVNGGPTYIGNFFRVIGWNHPDNQRHFVLFQARDGTGRYQTAFAIRDDGQIFSRSTISTSFNMETNGINPAKE